MFCHKGRFDTFSQCKGTIVIPIFNFIIVVRPSYSWNVIVDGPQDFQLEKIQDMISGTFIQLNIMGKN